MSHIRVELNVIRSYDEDKLETKTVVVERPMVGDYIAVDGSVLKVDVVRLIVGRPIDMRAWLTYVGPDKA
jgi:hypothetical protein